MRHRSPWATVLVLCLPFLAHGQSFPSKHITLYIGYAAGASAAWMTFNRLVAAEAR